MAVTAQQAADIAERIQEVKAEIAEQSATDSAFRSSLLADPQKTIEQEYNLPPGELKELELKVVVEEPGSLVIPIPPDMSEMELSDEQLDQVAGGAAFVGAVTAVVGAVTVAATVAQRTREGRSW